MRFLLNCLLLSLVLLHWQSEVAMSQTYYVSPSGDNARDRGLARNRDTPWKSIQTALNRAESGAKIIVLDGIYREHVDFVRGNMTLESERREGAFLIGSIRAEDLSGIRIDGFKLSNRRLDAPRSKGIEINRCDNITVRDCRVFNCRGGGINFDQSDQILCEWNIVFRNAFWDPAQHSGISVYQPQQRVADQPNYDIIIRNNTCFWNENKVDNVLFDRPTDGNGIVIDDTQNLTAPFGNGITYPGSILVENNLCYNNGGSGVHCYQSDDVVIRNNTLFKNTRVVEFSGEVTVGRGDNVRVFNNILFARDDSNAAFQYGDGFVWFNFNLVFNGPTFGVRNGSSTVYSAPFFDPDGFFDLRADSPAVDAGLTQYRRYGLDVDAKIRISGDAVDIGAKEFAY